MFWTQVLSKFKSRHLTRCQDQNKSQDTLLVQSRLILALVCGCSSCCFINLPRTWLTKLNTLILPTQTLHGTKKAFEEALHQFIEVKQGRTRRPRPKSACDPLKHTARNGATGHGQMVRIMRMRGSTNRFQTR